MKKKIRITFSNNEVYEVPASIIAEARTNYYMERDPNTTYEEELESSYDNYELYDWITGNMDWNDVKDHAVLIPMPVYPFDYVKGWNEAHVEIFEEE